MQEWKEIAFGNSIMEIHWSLCKQRPESGE